MDENIDALFQKAKEVPTEIPFKQMEKMILNFPNHPIPVTETHWFVKLFNLKYIAMTIIPIIAALTFWWAPKANQPEPVSSMIENSIKEKREISAISSKEPIVELTEEVVRKQIEKPATTLPKTPIQATEKTNLIAANIALPKIEPSIPEVKKERLELPKKEKKIFTQPSTLIKPDLIKTEPTPLSDISSFQLKKLRRTLYRNLVSDGIISNKHVLVEMELLGDKILVNNQPIPAKFLIKYQDLTSIVGVGPVRKIKMNTDFVLAGDFTEEGFKGHGFGRFSEKFIDLNPSFFESISLTEALSLKDDLLDEESKALNSFANDLLDKTPEDGGRKRLFAPNLKGKNPEDLHRKLTILLEEDGFINYSDLFGIIQLPKNSIRINGKELQGEQFKKYKKLIDEYGIKHGRNRMIMISEHHLRVGNYYYGTFSGLGLTLPLID